MHPCSTGVPLVRNQAKNDDNGFGCGRQKNHQGAETERSKSHRTGNGNTLISFCVTNMSGFLMLENEGESCRKYKGNGTTRTILLNWRRKTENIFEIKIFLN
jgi:hypothetical protein